MVSSQKISFALLVDFVITDEDARFDFHEINEGMPLPFTMTLVDAWLAAKKEQFTAEFKARYL